MAIPKGGRGRKAPYETTHVRVPVPIQEVVQAFIDEWKEAEVSKDKQEDNNSLTSLYCSRKIAEIYCLDKAVELALNILKHKESARKTLSKFLSKMYERDINL